MNRFIFTTKVITTLVLALGLAEHARAEASKKNTPVTRSNISNNQEATPECVSSADGGDCDDAASVKSPRDAASGMATGKRQHSPVTVRKELDKSSPGMAATADADGDGSPATAAQDHNSSRSNKTGSVISDGDGDGGGEPQGMAINEKGLPGEKKAKTGKSGSAK
jgi:hypothetical protein